MRAFHISANLQSPARLPCCTPCVQAWSQTQDVVRCFAFASSSSECATYILDHARKFSETIFQGHLHRHRPNATQTSRQGVTDLVLFRPHFLASYCYHNKYSVTSCVSALDGQGTISWDPPLDISKVTAQRARDKIVNQTCRISPITIVASD